MTQNFFSFDQKLITAANKAEQLCKEEFDKIEALCAYNESKMLKAFTECRVSESHFAGSAGYGYGDRGREVLDEVFAKVFDTEDALVRYNFVSGTHALSVALFGVLRPGDVILSVTGKPYDTMEEVIGLSKKKGTGSLYDFGIEYRQLDLTKDNTVDLAQIANKADGVKLFYIQRSRGYSLRESLTIDKIEQIVKVIRSVNKDAIIFVDNCYGEFVEDREPTSVGVDLVAGSLIKNAGGGIARTGGYIAGRKDLIELCADRLTCVSMGKEVGCTLGMNRELFLGLFMAPSVVQNALKTITFALCLFDQLGFKVHPEYNAKKTDIIGALELLNEQNLIAFCKGIQKGSPVDSFVTPEPWDMPGYDSKVIMAAGAFTMGASIELSADAPLREPYAVWLQGGITYNTGKLGIMHAAQELIDINAIK